MDGGYERNSRTHLEQMRRMPSSALFCDGVLDFENASFAGVK